MATMAATPGFYSERQSPIRFIHERRRISQLSADWSGMTHEHAPTHSSSPSQSIGDVSFEHIARRSPAMHYALAASSPVPSSGASSAWSGPRHRTTQTQTHAACGSMDSDADKSPKVSENGWFRKLRRSSSKQSSVQSGSPEMPGSIRRARNKLFSSGGKSDTTDTRPDERHAILGQSSRRVVEICGVRSTASERDLPTGLLHRSALNVPTVVDACVSYLIRHGAPTTPGVFRINGSSAAVKRLLEHFSSGRDIDEIDGITCESGQPLTIYDVASCLKKYLVSLPAGLLGQKLFSELLEITEVVQHGVPAEVDGACEDVAAALRDIVDRHKFNTLCVVMALLALIDGGAASLTAADGDAGKLMNARALAIVFAPVCCGQAALLSPTASSGGARSSTSMSDHSRSGVARTSSIGSDGKAGSIDKVIEDELRAAEQGSSVIYFLIRHWAAIVRHMKDDEAASLEQAIGGLDIGNYTTTKDAHALEDRTPALTAESSPSLDGPTSPDATTQMELRAVVGPKTTTAEDIDALQKCLGQESGDEAFPIDDGVLKPSSGAIKVEKDVVIQGLSLIDMTTKSALPTGDRAPASPSASFRSTPSRHRMSTGMDRNAIAAAPIMDSRFSISPVPPASHGSDMSSSPVRHAVRSSPPSSRYTTFTSPPSDYEPFQIQRQHQLSMKQHQKQQQWLDDLGRSADSTASTQSTGNAASSSAAAAFEEELRIVRQDLRNAEAEIAQLVDANLKLKQENVRLRRSAVVLH